MKDIRIIIAAALVLCAIFTAACWDAVELSDTAIVLGIGIDGNEEEITLTIELSGAESSDSTVMQSSAKSISECVKIIQSLNGEELFWGGTAVIVYGESLNEKWLADSALFLYRDLDVSGNTPILRTEKSSSSDVLHGSIGQSPSVSLGLSEAIHRNSAAADNMDLIALIEGFMDTETIYIDAAVEVDENGAVRMADEL